MKILCNKQKDDGVFYHRLLVPLEHLKKNYGVQYKFTEDVGYLSEDDLSHDIFLFSRIFSAYENLKICFDMLKAEFKVVMDLDDYWFLPPSHPSYAEWNSSNVPLLMESHIRNSDYVITTNKRLYKEIRKINRNVVVIENALDEQRFPKDKNTSDRLRLGFTGGISHHSDVEKLEPILERLHKSYDFDMVYAGYLEGNEYSEKIRKSLSYGKDCLLLPYADIHTYMNCYKDIDVLIAPMSDTKFNACKSNLKILECIATNTWFVGDYVHPFKDDMSHTFDIEHQLVSMLEGEPIDILMSETKGRKYNLSYINDKRYEFFQSII